MAAPAPVRIEDRRRRSRPEWTPSGLVLQSETEWVVKGPPEVIAAIEGAVPAAAERLDEHLLLLCFGNEVGFVELPGLGRVELRSRKWGREHFHRMLEELARIASTLPFSFARPVALPFRRTARVARDVLYHAWVYLRWAAFDAEGEDNLLRAFRLVISDPHRLLVRGRRRIPPALASRLDVRALHRLAAGAEELVPAPGSGSPVAVALRGHVPETVEETIARRSPDTAENRFVLSLLEECLWIVERVEREVLPEVSDPLAARRLRRDTARLARELGLFRRAPLWRDIGPMLTVPVASTVLQRRRGYRGLFRHFVRLRLAARVPLAGPAAHGLLDSRDIATLYELWCFFRVVEALSRLAGRPEEASVVTTGPTRACVAHGYTVRWRNGLRAVYNLRFSRSESVHRRSYSVALRPDIAIEVPRSGGSELHLLDAKFRLVRADDLFAGDDAGGIESPEAAFTRADLYTMHTYRDAIPAARSVWILYPGDRFRFFSEDGADLREPARVPAPPSGVGAIPLRPGEGGGGLAAALSAVVGGAG